MYEDESDQCDQCGAEMFEDASHFDDICDECAENEGYDGPWNWNEEEK